jgi:hypothetical protein
MPEYADVLVTHAHLFTMQGEGVGYVADGGGMVVSQYIRCAQRRDLHYDRQ